MKHITVLLLSFLFIPYVSGEAFEEEIRYIPITTHSQTGPISKVHWDHTYLPLELDFNYCNNFPAECRRINSVQNRYPRFEIRERATKAQWAVFWSLQFLDVYTTKRGLSYNCVKEINPFLPDRPSTARVVLHKATFLGYPLLRSGAHIDNQALREFNIVTTFVVANNVDIINHAKSNCPQ